MGLWRLLLRTLFSWMEEDVSCAIACGPSLQRQEGADVAIRTCSLLKRWVFIIYPMQTIESEDAPKRWQLHTIPYSCWGLEVNPRDFCNTSCLVWS